MSIALSSWLKDILPRTPGLVRSVAKRELLLTVREFYEQSYAWRGTVGPLDIIADQASYKISPEEYDEQADVIGILGATYDTIPLYKRALRPSDTTRTADRPNSFYATQPDTMVIFPAPTADADDKLLVYVAFTPTLDATGLPEIASTLHREALFDGVLGRLYGHPAKAYSNPMLGQYHLKRFRAAIAQYAAKAKGGLIDAPSWAFPMFGK